MKNYKEFIISTNPFDPDLLSGLLWNLNIAGIVENENHLIISSLEENNIQKSDISQLLENCIKENLIENYSIEEKSYEDQNWNEEWEKKLNVIKVTDNIVIKPTFKEYAKKNNEIVIEIDPKMSFGTGEHQTTKLVLKALEKYFKQDSFILDVGSGTGILAIAAILMGGEKAIAIDNDEWCLLNGKENIKLNNISDKIEVRLNEISEVKENNFDIILANINKNVLLNINEDIIKRLKIGGTVILSGILENDEAQIKKSYSIHNLKFKEKFQIDEWIALIFN